MKAWLKHLTRDVTGFDYGHYSEPAGYLMIGARLICDGFLAIFAIVTFPIWGPIVGLGAAVKWLAK